MKKKWRCVKIQISSKVVMADAGNFLKANLINETNHYLGANYSEIIFATRSGVHRLIEEVQAKIYTQQIIRDRLVIDYNQLMLAAKRDHTILKDNPLCPDIALQRRINVENYWYNNYIIAMHILVKMIELWNILA